MGDLSFQNNVPDPLLAGKELPTFKFELEKSKGKVLGNSFGKEVTVEQLPISKEIAGVSIQLEPGVMRELHWHPNTDEWQYVVVGDLSVTMVGSHGRFRTELLHAGDVGYIPQGYGHSIENVGSGWSRILIAFNSGIYESIDLSAWIASNPVDVLATNFNKPESLIRTFPRKDVFIAPSE
jgi:oxalate decarboxylase